MKVLSRIRGFPNLEHKKSIVPEKSLMMPKMKLTARRTTFSWAEISYESEGVTFVQMKIRKKTHKPEKADQFHGIKQ